VITAVECSKNSSKPTQGRNRPKGKPYTRKPRSEASKDSAIVEDSNIHCKEGHVSNESSERNSKRRVSRRTNENISREGQNFAFQTEEVQFSASVVAAAFRQVIKEVVEQSSVTTGPAAVTKMQHLLAEFS
jgi:hypothetical protein